MEEDDDPLTLAHACYLVAMTHSHLQVWSMAQKLTKRSMEIIRRRNIRFVMAEQKETSTSPPTIPALSEEIHERVAFLASVLYTETFLYLIAGGSTIYFDSDNKDALPVRLLVAFILPPR